MKLVSVAVCLGLFGSIAASGTARADIKVYPRQGRSTDSHVAPQGPGVIVMGGNYDVDSAFVWMHDTIAGPGGADGGDVVVLRDPDPQAGHDDDYTPYLLKLAGFNSVQTVVLSGTVSASDAAQAAQLVDQAEAVFFGGGDQRDYVGWKGPVLDAVQRVYDRRGVVGGTSAGSAIWGAYVNDAIGEYHHGSTLSPGAVANPYEASITFTNHLFTIPPLARVITDSHFKVRDRFGRLAVFTARLLADGAATGHVLGVGVDEDNALVVDRNGVGTLKQYTPGTGGAWILRGGAAKTISQGKPLVDTLAVMRLDADGQFYDFTRECGSGASYSVAIDGSTSSVYTPADPYSGSGGPVVCSALPPDAGAPPPPAGVDAGSTGGGGPGGNPNPPPGGGGGGGSGGGAGPGSIDGGTGSSGTPDAPTELLPATASGCACTTTPRPSGGDSAAALLGLSAIAIVAARRRRAGPNA